MRYLMAFAFLTVGWGMGDIARADGLVFQLPQDGAWARYAVEAEGSQRIGEFEQAISVSAILTVSSVGRIVRNQQTCRWIELRSESKDEGMYSKLVLKMLIPESRLQRGQDPLAHVILAFFNPKPVDEEATPSVESFIDDGFNRIQYEIDRFRVSFPKPLDNCRTRKHESVQTPAGRFDDCEVQSGTVSYDGPLLGDGRSVFTGSYRITIHPESPFGVVAMSADITGRAIADAQVVHTTCEQTITLIETGDAAVSDLPERTAAESVE